MESHSRDKGMKLSGTPAVGRESISAKGESSRLGVYLLCATDMSDRPRIG